MLDISVIKIIQININILRDIIQCRNGFDPSDYFCLTVTQQKAIKRKVTAYIRDNGIEEYADLIDTLMDSDEGDMYDIASQNTFFFTQYIKSKKGNLKNKIINTLIIKIII